MNNKYNCESGGVIFTNDQLFADNCKISITFNYRILSDTIEIKCKGKLINSLVDFESAALLTLVIHGKKFEIKGVFRMIFMDDSDSTVEFNFAGYNLKEKF